MRRATTNLMLSILNFIDELGFAHGRSIFKLHVRGNDRPFAELIVPYNRSVGLPSSTVGVSEGSETNSETLHGFETPLSYSFYTSHILAKIPMSNKVHVLCIPYRMKNRQTTNTIAAQARRVHSV